MAEANSQALAYYCTSLTAHRDGANHVVDPSHETPEAAVSHDESLRSCLVGAAPVRTGRAYRRGTASGRQAERQPACRSIGFLDADPHAVPRRRADAAAPRHGEQVRRGAHGVRTRGLGVHAAHSRAHR